MSKIVGYRYVQYTSKKDGKPREGYEIYAEDAFPSYQKDACGVTADKYWASVDAFLEAELSIGKEVDFLFDKRGRLVRIL